MVQQVSVELRGEGGGGGAVYFPSKSPSGYPGGAGGSAPVSITIDPRSNSIRKKKESTKHDE